MCEALLADPTVGSWLREMDEDARHHELLLIWQAACKARDGSETEEEAALKGEIARLAGLPLQRYALERRAAAKTLKIPAAMLDRLVTAKHKENGAEPGQGQGQPVVIPQVEPWPGPVDGGELLSGLAKALRKYVVVLPQQADAMALWVMRTHVHAAFDTNPVLWITSVEMRSGKSRTCAALYRVVARSVYASSITAASLLRVAEMLCPTVILDELDALIKRNPEMGEALRGLLNSCFDRATAYHVMTVPMPDGGGHEPRQFNTYVPVILAGIGEVAGTVRDRAIRLEMRRKLKGERVARLSIATVWIFGS
jgi:hypothetical protein